MLKTASPADVGLDAGRWQRVLELAAGDCRDGRAPAIALAVARGGRTTGVHGFGRQRLAADSPPLRDDAIFLVASITKPVVAMGALLLVERGLLTLADRVSDFVPGFLRIGKAGVTIRHLLTHTSGLPDMLPDNRELRAANAPLASFVENTCEVRPDFPPGRGVQYQSMGFAVLGEVLSHVTGLSCAEFLRREVFEPLGMHDTALGAPETWFSGPAPVIDRVPEIRVPPEQADGPGWNWNSRYWRTLGAPWGGLLTTPSDLGRFAQAMLNRGRPGGVTVWSPATIAAATRNQLEFLPDVPEADRRCRPWGLGWRLQWPAHSANFGDLLGPRSFGHWGATGTVLWIDPDLEAFAVILTTQPQEPQGSLLSKLSNAIAAALL
ncbi:MAG TPA: serine hydrolase domain-containing protein [Planctomycetaceae bacterium]|nr:serine hydrolase domain-containing protein [Planctomycetaceae bacterium]